ncbi:MAG TPA: TonB-dependent receptor, partial [Steroidobacteraceae bacterium]|nr:TonB-dependent receptor [Steroidobacteraceae bacterium]
SVRFQAEGASTELYIRGVGSTLDLPNIEPPTVFNFNGVYIPREGTSVGLFDIASVELLPGPQGTLYGRAALGGTVNVGFNRPTQQFETNGLLEIGDYSLVHGTFVQNLPVSDALALRGAFDYIEHDGYQATGADSKQDYAGRVSALYEPNDELDVYVWLHGARKDGNSPNLVRRGYNDGTFDGDPEAYDHADPWDDRIDPGAPTASPNEYESFGAGAQVDWRLDGLTLTYLPSYFYLDWDGRYWLENIGAQLTAHYNQVTQEFRVASDADARLRWLGGLYYYRVANDGDFFTYTNTPAPFPLAQIDDNRLEGYAAFGQATYELTETLRLVAGGRFSWDRREGEGRTADGTPYSAEEDYDHFDWKVGVEKDLAAAVMAYANVQTGYQPGTYNMFPSSDDDSNLVRSATMTAYTAGIKTRFLDGRLQVNDEVFHYDYEDLLVQSFNFNTFLLTTFNADSSTIYGNQLDVLFEPTDSDLLNVTVGYLHAEYDEFVVPEGVDIGIAQRDFGGYPLQYAPEWTLTAGYQRDFTAGAGNLRARIETRYEDEFWGTFAQNRGTRQDDYFKTDASLTYYPADDRWSLGLWIRNIENVAVLAATTTGQFGPYGDAFIEPPRTYGARFTFRL